MDDAKVKKLADDVLKTLHQQAFTYEEANEFAILISDKISNAHAKQAKKIRTMPFLAE